MNKETKKIIATIKIEDKGQDFIEIDVLKNGVISGNSPIFMNNRISMIGVGTLNGKKYWTFKKMKEDLKDISLAGLYLYIKQTGEIDPLPWKAKTLNYKIINIK